MKFFVDNRKRLIIEELQVNLDEQKAQKKKKQNKRDEKDKDDEEIRCKVFKENDYGVTLWNNSVLILAVVNAVAQISKRSCGERVETREMTAW